MRVRGPGRMVLRTTGLLCLGAAALPRAVDAQEIAGRIVDAESLGGISSAIVEIFDDAGTRIAVVLSTGQGEFRIRLETGGGPFRLEAGTLFHRGISLDSLVVAPGEILRLPEILLERAPVVLEGIVAEVPRPRLTPGREWIRTNQLLGQGTFLSGAVIRAEAPSSLTQYVAERVDLWASVNLNYSVSRATADFDPLSVGGGGVNRFGQPVLSMPPGTACNTRGDEGVAVLINRWPIGRTGYLSLDDIPPERIAAIEIYSHHRDVPPGYAWDTECALVNVWTWDSY